MLNLRSDTAPDLLTSSGDDVFASTRVDLDSIIVSHVEPRRSMTRPRERHARDRSVNYGDGKQGPLAHKLQSPQRSSPCQISSSCNSGQGVQAQARLVRVPAPAPAPAQQECDRHTAENNSIHPIVLTGLTVRYPAN